MLPRERRLRPRSQVRQTIRRGRRVRCGSVVLHHVPDGLPTRAAVVIGRGLGGSVARHHRQRQLRHALASMWDQLPAGALVVRAVSDDAAYPLLITELRQAVGRL